MLYFSGQHIPKASGNIEGEVIDPYVKVKVYGHEKDKGKFVTKHVMNNGEPAVKLQKKQI